MVRRKKDSFKEFVLDQLRALGPVDCKAMFGGYGLYYDEIFFGIISKGQLYFKTDQTTVKDYQEKGMQPFRPNFKQTLKNYYEVPAEILEDGEELAKWARESLEISTGKN